MGAPRGRGGGAQANRRGHDERRAKVKDVSVSARVVYFGRGSGECGGGVVWRMGKRTADLS
jgi:hypothetical protein